MSNQKSPSSDTEGRVVNFPRGGAAGRTPPKPAGENLAEYQGGAESASDYRHRMAVNAVVFIFVLALIGGALWLADTMASLRKNQDCALSGRRGCTPVEVNRDGRW